MQVVYNRCLIQMGQLGHVVCFVKFRGVNFVNVFHVDFSLLSMGISISETSCDEGRGNSYTTVITLHE
jgi:hypothetical protein